MKTLSAKYQLAVIISLLIGLNSFGQQTKNYINNWYFGDAVGISFNSGTATNTTSAIQSYEVSTSYSDGNGNVLFYGGASNNTAYGDGRVIWDASHDTMPNSNIHVDYSSSCGLTAVPVPGNCDQYYIFHLVGSTPASVGMGNSLHYSVVDMTLPGNGTIPAPLGDIDPAQKDILVYGPDTLAEKVKIVQQGNTENYWVITRSINRDVFYSFEVTSAGVNTIPVISTISATTWPTAIGSPAFSWLAVNKDRNKIAEANGFGPEVKLYDFDNLTGLLSLVEYIIPTGTFGSDLPYGIEFSPSGNVLYVNWYEGGTNTYISSFDITVGSPGIAATRQDYLIATGAAQYGALVKAPDGKIYGTRETTTQLIVINSPENYLAPNITTPGFNPSPGSSDVGMPNLTYYYHPDNFIDTLAGNDRIGTCSPFQTEIGAIGYDSIWANYVWSPASMLAGSASEATPLTVILTADQEYILHVIHACGDTIKSDTMWVRVNSATTPTIYTPDSWYCVGDNITSLNTDTGDLWYDDAGLTNLVGVGDSLIPPVILGTTTYYVVDTTGGCTSLPDSVTVTFENCSYPCATNILTNGDFETFSPCPTGPNDLPNATGWIDVQGNSNDYFNCSYFGHPSGATYPGFNSLTTNMFFPPSGTGYTGIVLNGTGLVGREGYGQQVTLRKCVEYTIQLRVAHNRLDGQPDNDLCIYAGNTATTAPCMSTYDQLACISRDSISLNWSVFTLTFTPTQDYSYLAFAGACPTIGTLPIGGYVYIDDAFLCADTCLNVGSINSLFSTPESCLLNDGAAAVNLNTVCYTGYDFSWENAANPGVVVSTDSLVSNLPAGTYNVIVTDSNLCAINASVTIPYNCFISCPGNLVPNPSFETNSGFPSALGDFALATNWNNCNGTATPDYLNISGTNAAMLPVGVGGIGKFNPNSGSGIMALIIKGELFGDYREYMDVPLTTPLIVGATYDVSFYMANAGDLGKNGLRSNNIGVNFSVGALTQVGFAALNIVPTWNYNTVFYDTTWTLVSFQFTPTAAVDHITIGNFYNDVATTTVNHIPSALQKSYVGFDDFCVTPAIDSLIISNDTFICQGDSVLLVSSGSNSGYNWIDSITSLPLIPLVTDSFYMASPLVTTTFGVYNATDTVYTAVTVYNSSSSNTILSECDGFSITINGNTYTTTGIYNDTLASGNTNGCDSIVTTNLTINPLPNTGVNGAVTFCPADPAADLFTQLGVGADLGGTWSPVMTSGTGVFDPATDAAGLYTYTITNSCGTSSDTVTVTISTNPSPGTNGVANICSNAIAINLLDSLGGTPSAGGTWSPAMTSGTGVFDPATDAAGPYTYTVNDCSGSPLTATVTVTILASPNSGANGAITLCSVDPATDLFPQLGTGVDVGGTWSPVMTSGTGVFDPATDAATTYTYTITNSCGTSGSNVIVTVNVCTTPVSGYTVSDSIICEGGCIVITDASSSGVTWEWTFNGGTPLTSNVQNPGTVCFNTAGNYTIEQIVSNGFGADTTTSTVVVNATPTISAGANVTLELGQSTTLNATGTNGTYTWTPPTWLDCPTCVSPISTPEQTITYTVIVVDSNGCQSTDQVTVFVDFEYVIWVPNIFSPNGDGNNDVVFVRGTGVESFQFVVYDRWGEKVFETQDLDKGWNGSFRGKEMNKAVFVYYLKGFFIDGTEFNQKGDITLIR